MREKKQIWKFVLSSSKTWIITPVHHEISENVSNSQSNNIKMIGIEMLKNMSNNSSEAYFAFNMLSYMFTSKTNTTRWLSS